MTNKFILGGAVLGSSLRLCRRECFGPHLKGLLVYPDRLPHALQSDYFGAQLVGIGSCQRSDEVLL